MQKEIDADSTAAAIQILGVNGVGQESGNASICANRVLPWLQDTEQQGVWTKWDVTWRDVVILDEQNEVIAIYNLTEHNLADPANYDALKSLLLHGP
jgi:hypothetical protein